MVLNKERLSVVSAGEAGKSALRFRGGANTVSLAATVQRVLVAVLKHFPFTNCAHVFDQLVPLHNLHCHIL